MASVFLSNHALAQQEPEKPARILFLLDASGSMSHAWQGEETRFQAASRVIMMIMDSIRSVNPDVSFGLRAFGEQYPAKDSNCYDTRLEVPFGYMNYGQMERRLQWLRPQGFSPIALSLAQAAEEDFTQDNRYAYSIILVTDGGESCGGDICATVQNLLNKKISFTPYILSLVNYKPLLDSYNCLGKVLVITQNKDIPPAVQQIVSDNRRVLTVKGRGLQRTPTAPRPSPPPPQPKPVPQEPQEVVSEATPQPETPEQPPVKEQAPPPAAPAPAAKPMIRIAPIASMQPTTKLRPYHSLPAPKTIAIPAHRIFTLVAENEPVMAPSVVKNKPATPKPAPQPVATRGTQKVDFYTTTENAAKTTLLVYFTDGHGKFYHTEPMMKILNSATGKEVKQVSRNMAGSEPAPIEIAAGVYDISIPGSRSEAAHVTIQANKTNKVYIKAGMASLSFYYTTQPNRPVKEYKAYVSNRFGQRKVVVQPCDTALAYHPENYHIEINTLPKLVYNIDLNFNQEKKVAIPTPGTFQIMNTNPMEQAQLYYQLGGEYVPFLQMKITGDPKAQQVDLLPGFYQVRYFKAPYKPYDVSIIIPFRIKSEQTTSITLAD